MSSATDRRPHVIVTGGSGGIGNAVIDRLVHERQARCSALDFGVEETADGADVRHFHCDVTDPDAVESAVAEACAWAGTPTGLVAAAGIASSDATLTVPIETWRTIMSVHVDGTLLVGRAVAVRMIESGTGGSIVNLCSEAMFMAVPGRAAYGAAKAAIGSLTKTLSCEWARHGIRVNAVAPGSIRTPMYEDLARRGVIDQQRVTDLYPLGRVGEPSEVAAAVDFLISNDSSFITGEILRIDGGVSAMGIDSLTREGHDD